jgi:hypothetical protein
MDGLIFFTILIFLMLLVSSYYAVKFGLLLLSLEDDIEASLDDIDESYKALTEILKKPVFFDSIEVRKCIEEIRNCRRVVIKIADRLTSFGESRTLLEEKGNNETVRKEKNKNN